MAVITISSDLGVNNYSVSSWFSSLSLAFPNDHVNHLFHHDDAYDIETIAYHVKGALQLFPIHSIHVVVCKYSLMNYDLILLRMKDQFVLTSNNGVASMILNDELNDSVYKFSSQMNTFDFQQYIDQFIFVLNLIANNKYANVLEVNPSIVQTKPFTNGLMIREDSIISRVVAIRSSGSIILNLSKDQFDTAVGDKSFYIQFVNIKIRSISPNYMVSETNNKMGAIFNESGFLEIFMIGGNLAKLFNINKYSNNKIEIIIGTDAKNQIGFE